MRYLIVFAGGLLIGRAIVDFIMAVEDRSILSALLGAVEATIGIALFAIVITEIVSV